MKKIILLAFILGLLPSSYSQTNTETTLSTVAKIDLGLQGLGLTYEPRISNSVTTDLSAGVGGGYDISESALSYDYIKPALYISATPKYYYNLKQRIKREKLFNLIRVTISGSGLNSLLLYTISLMLSGTAF